MLRLLYNALWYPALPLALLAGGAPDGPSLRQRLGRVGGALAAGRGRSRLWLHAASVGEVEAVRPLVLRLLAERPGADLVITTMTEAGRAAARRWSGVAGRTALLAPLDMAAVVRAFLGAVQPALVLITETELWPNYFFEARRAGARIAIVNGRISERSLRHYRWVRPLLAGALAQADLVLAQTETDARRFAALGARPERIAVSGNTKLDLAELGPQSLRAELESFAAGRPILVAGSTAPGEEAIVLDAYGELGERFPALALVLAPRHLERSAETAALLRSRGLVFLRASQLGAATTAAEARVLLLDTMGELRALYRRAAVAFVGGSMAPGRGGQNLAEPAGAAAPVLFGPFHENQREVALGLIAGGGGRVVAGAHALAVAVAELLSDEAGRRAAGRQAFASLRELGGGVERSLQHLRPLAAGI